MVFSIKFSEDKNQLLKATRGIGFEEVIHHLHNGGILADKVHHSNQRSNQRIYVIKVNKYAYVVPYILNKQNKEIFLKTIYPSRTYTKLYIKEGGKDE